MEARPKVLILSRNYPNKYFEHLGLWVERQVHQSTVFCEPKVIAPVQYMPPLPGIGEYYSRFSKIESHEWMNGVEIFRPRYLAGMGYSMHNLESLNYYLGVWYQIAQVRKIFPFDLIHAHFTYPDGVVGAMLGRHYRVPVIITEQNFWRPWLDDYPIVRRQAVWAAKSSAFHLVLSHAARASIAHFTGDAENLRVLPDGVDGDVFAPSSNRERVRNQILFVGAVRPVKGLDILLSAMRFLAQSHPDLKLVVAGDSFFRTYRAEYDRLQQLVRDWGFTDRIQFVGKQSDADLVKLIQASAMLVLPSRLESLGVVLLEALACGIPVVATRSGGPEDIVNERVGVLVPPENPEALAQGIVRVLEHLNSYDSAALRAYVLENFGLESVGQRLAAYYVEAIARFGKSSTQGASVSKQLAELAR